MKVDTKRWTYFSTNIYVPWRATSRVCGMAEIRNDRTTLTRLLTETTSAERVVGGTGRGRGWIAARFGSKPPRGTSRIERRAISFADCRYRQPLPKYLIPKRLELSMDYKPIYYFPVPFRVSRGGSHEHDVLSILIEFSLGEFKGTIAFLRRIVVCRQHRHYCRC